MALTYWAYIFLSPEFDSKKDIAVLSSPKTKVKIVGISIHHKEEVLTVAQQLAEEGVQLIELCGGLGPYWMTKVAEVTQGTIPIGGVFYGPEARQPMLNIMRE